MCCRGSEAHFGGGDEGRVVLVQQLFDLLAALLLGGCQLASELVDAALVQALQLLFQLEGAVLKRSQPASQVLICIVGPASCKECRYRLRPLFTVAACLSGALHSRFTQTTVSPQRKAGELPPAAKEVGSDLNATSITR